MIAVLGNRLEVNVSTWTASRGRAHVSRAWSEEEALSKEISKEDSIPSSAREGEDNTRSRTVDIQPLGECQVATSGSFSMVIDRPLMKSCKYLAAPGAALGAMHDDQSEWCRLVSPARIQCACGGTSKVPNRRSAVFVSSGAAMYIELIKSGHGDPSCHLTFSTTVQMSRVGERSCLYCTLSAVPRLWTNSMARGLSVSDEADQVDASGRKV